MGGGRGTIVALQPSMCLPICVGLDKNTHKTTILINGPSLRLIPPPPESRASVYQRPIVRDEPLGNWRIGEIFGICSLQGVGRINEKGIITCKAVKGKRIKLFKEGRKMRIP